MYRYLLLMVIWVLIMLFTSPVEASFSLVPPVLNSENGLNIINNFNFSNTGLITTIRCNDGGFYFWNGTKRGATFQACVSWEWFDGNEAIKIEWTVCNIDTIVHGDGYFIQTCTIRRLGKHKRVTIYDTVYDMEIESPEQYRYIDILQK